MDDETFEWGGVPSPWRQTETTLGEPALHVDLDDAKRGAFAERGADLAYRSLEPISSGGTLCSYERQLEVAPGEPTQLQREVQSRRRDLSRPGMQRGSQQRGVGGRLAQGNRGAPRTAAHEARAEHKRPRLSGTTVRVGEEALE